MRHNQKITYFSLHTSKPLSRLVKASFNPLVAEEIFSSTMLINERCSFERAACSRRPVSVSGQTPNCVGPFSSPPVGAERSGLRAAEGLASGFGRSGLLRDDTSEKSSREELLAGLQRMDPGYCSRRKAVPSCLRSTYNSAEGWPIGGHDAVRTPFGTGPPGEAFFPCLGTSVSKSSEATLFFPRGEEALDSPSYLSSFGEVAIPPVWMRNV